MSLIEAREVSYDYIQKAGVTHALKDVNVSFESKKVYAVMGRSGSGKTTLLSMLAAFDRPKSGNIMYNGESIYSDPIKYRREKIGMVFQAYNLIPHLTSLENVMLAMSIRGANKDKREKAIEAMVRAQVSPETYNKYPNTLSGGEQQRVAIARAVVSDPEILLADEPTGNLDNANSNKIIGVFAELAHTYGKCVIIVTHSDEIASAADEVFIMSDGKITKR